MSNKKNNLSALGEKISHKSVSASIHRRFEVADESMIGSTDQKVRERVIRKSYAITKHDVDNIKRAKDKCLNQRVVLSDSHIVRTAIAVLADLSEDAIIAASNKVLKILAGRPKNGEIKKLPL